MATTYTRTTLGQVTNLTATAVAGGSLTASTQFWFTVIPISSTYLYSIQNACGTPATIATATTTVANKTINLAWDATSGAAGYMVYWTKVDPAGDVTAFNSTGWNIRAASGLYNVSSTTNSFAFSTEQTTGSPTYSVTYSDSYRYLQIFNQKCDYILLQNVDSDVTPEKIYQACVLNSWDSVTKLDDYAYDFKTNIYVATIGSVTDFRGTSIQTIGGLQCYTANSMFKAGYSDINSIEDGGSWVNLGGQAVSWWNMFHFNNVRMHGFSYRNIRKGYKGVLTSRYSFISIAGTDWQLSNCNFAGAAYLSLSGGAIAGSYLKNSVLHYSRWGLNISSDISLATIDNVRMISAQIPLYLQKTVTASGVSADYTQSNNIIAINSSDATETKATLTDCDLSLSGATDVYWYNSGRTTTGNEYVKSMKTQTFHITDSLNNALQSASITLTDKDGTVYSGTTDASGNATMIPMVGIHHATPGATTNHYGYWTDQNPFTIRVSKTNYQTMENTLTIDDTQRHTLALVDRVPTFTIVANKIRDGLYVGK